MKIRISGRKCSVNDHFTKRAEKKLEKVGKFFGDNADAKVTVSVDKELQIVEITVRNAGILFRAEESATDRLEALDACVDSLIRKIRKNKTKVERKMRQNSFDALLADLQADPMDDGEEEMEFDVVRTKAVPMKPEFVDEAILQMNMLGHQFYMFLNAATDRVNVVYKRHGSGYGLLEPDMK